MPVIRVNHTDNYTVMSNAHLRDKELSLKAKGLLSQILSLPPDWDYTIEGLVGLNQEKATAITSALKELREHGYLVVTKLNPSQTKSGRYEYVYDFYEHKQESKKQDLEFLGLENQGIENLGLYKSTDTQNTDKQSTETKNKKHRYGQFKHVLLTDEELSKLQDRFNDWQLRIERLDEGIELKGYKYKNHYLAILKWAQSEKPTQKSSEYNRFMASLQQMYDEAVANGE